MTEQLKDINRINHTGENQDLLTDQIVNEQTKKVYPLIDFEEETLASVSRLVKAIRKIRRRMHADGYTVKNGILIKLN